MKVGPALAGVARQRAYEDASAAETIRLTIEPPAGLDPNPALATELIRGLHPRQRRGFDGWKVGWPSLEFRVVWRDRQLAWEGLTNRQMARLAEAQLRSLYPGLQVDAATSADRPATAVAVGRLVSSSAWPLREVATAEARVLRALAGALETAGSPAEVRLRVLARPVPPDVWQRQVGPRTGSSSPSMRTIIGTAIIDGPLFRETSSLPAKNEPPQLPPAERDAQTRKRRGVVGFDVAMALEVTGVDATEAEALLWRLVHFTQELDDGAQDVRWEIRRGATARVPRARLADWELAQLWYLPDASFDRGGFARSRPLGAAPPAITPGVPLVIGRSGAQRLAIPSAVLPTHLAAFGATGSGKSTLLLNLVLGLTEAEIGATVIDPHGDLTDDILHRLPREAASRIHVLRLADREHPRGFNFLECRSPGQAQLVTSEFVGLFEDLWPRFCGPKMQHYLRHAARLRLVHHVAEGCHRTRCHRRRQQPGIPSFGPPSVGCVGRTFKGAEGSNDNSTASRCFRSLAMGARANDDQSMEATSVGGDRIIKRWDRCPGWDLLLDRADELVRRDTSRAGHKHWVQARSKNARIDFDASLQERFDYLCPELREALDAIEDESLQTCQMCGAPGEERPSHYYSTLCVEHAQATRSD